MILRLPAFPAVLAASMTLAVVPAVAQSHGNNFADTTTQQASPYSGTVIEEIVARINDQVISKSDYERAEQELEQEARQQGWNQQQLMEQKRDLLRSLIDRQLLLSKGKELGITGETEVVRRLDEIRKQNHLDNMEDLQKAAETQGVSFEDFKEQIRENVITSQVISQQVGSHIQVAPSEIQAYYNEHKQEFERPESERLSEILIPTPNPDDAAQVADAKKKADGVEDRLKSGADFATVAKADSGGSTAAQGGDLGTYKRGQLAKVLEDATFDLKPGQVTQPIRTKQGWLILKVTDHQSAGLEPLEEAQNQIQQEIGMQKMQPALRAYLEQLRNESFVEVRSPYVDSGATPNEIKFVQSAYTPPGPKKKKHVTRARFRQTGSRKQKATQTAGTGVPVGVPTLDKVNSQRSAPAQVADAATQKPGKKEKIRFGQAPRETLPAGPTREVDAGAGGTAVASTDSNAVTTDVQGDVVDPGADSAKPKKTRFSDRAKQTKAQRKAEEARKKQDKFTPPQLTPEQETVEKQQNSALGLNGDTTKIKKPNPAKTGPKRRYSDDKKTDQQSENPVESGAPSSAATPAGSPSPQSAPATQGTGPSNPQ
jgi:peptidyl-prolyl cis-trans isomerase SurA